MSDQLSNQRIDELINLLHLEMYTPKEAAAVLHMDEDLILNAAFGGELKAVIINGDVVEMSRADLISWIQSR